MTKNGDFLWKVDSFQDGYLPCAYRPTAHNIWIESSYHALQGCVGPEANARSAKDNWGSKVCFRSWHRFFWKN